MIYKNNGIKKLVQFYKLDNLVSSLDEKIQLKKIILGCMLNILNDKSEYQEIAIEHNLIDAIIETLETNRLSKGSIVYNCLLVLFCFLDNESTIECLKNYKLLFNLIDQISSLNLKTQIKTISQLDEIDLETIESIIDLLMQLCNNENEIKFKLIEKGIIELLIEILDHELIEDEQLLKTSSNLTITLISDELIAKQYYNNGKGLAYSDAKKWLSNYIVQFEQSIESIEKENLVKQNSDLNILNNLTSDLIEKDDSIQQKVKPKQAIKENTQLITSALMIGNFSSCNENSIAIAKDGLCEKLVKVIELNDDFTIQFACLSTLRNLSIPNF